MNPAMVRSKNDPAGSTYLVVKDNEAGKDDDSRDGYIRVINVPCGDYSITETNAPEGYVAVTLSKGITVTHDHQAKAKFCNEQAALDFGDAPDSGPYPTVLASNGARHIIVSGFFMGVSVDSEPNGQPDNNALGDDKDLRYPPPNDDEDGVTFDTPLVKCQQANITVTASRPGMLDAWIDFNADGDWNDSWSDGSEQMFASQPLGVGPNTLTFTVPCEAAVTDRTYARFRFSTAGGLSYVGPASDGEVEDYQVVIESGSCNPAIEIVKTATLCCNGDDDDCCHHCCPGDHDGCDDDCCNGGDDDDCCHHCCPGVDPLDVSVGDTVTYCYEVTNTGDVILYNVNVNDDIYGNVPLAKTVLVPDESTNGTLPHVVVESDKPSVTNIATANGETAKQEEVTDTDDCTIIVNQQIGTIIAHKFNDVNGNGIQDGGEANLQGWTMTLYSGDNCRGKPLQSGETDSSGNKTFTGMAQGTYSVKETMKYGWTNICDLCRQQQAAGMRRQTSDSQIP